MKFTSRIKMLFWVLFYRCVAIINRLITRKKQTAFNEPKTVKLTPAREWGQCGISLEYVPDDIKSELPQTLRPFDYSKDEN